MATEPLPKRNDPAAEPLTLLACQAISAISKTVVELVDEISVLAVRVSPPDHVSLVFPALVECSEAMKAKVAALSPPTPSQPITRAEKQESAELVDVRTNLWDLLEGHRHDFVLLYRVLKIARTIIADNARSEEYLARYPEELGTPEAVAAYRPKPKPPIGYTAIGILKALYVHRIKTFTPGNTPISLRLLTDLVLGGDNERNILESLGELKSERLVEECDPFEGQRMFRLTGLGVRFVRNHPPPSPFASVL